MGHFLKCRFTTLTVSFPLTLLGTAHIVVPLHVLFQNILLSVGIVEALLVSTGGTSETRSIIPNPIRLLSLVGTAVAGWQECFSLQFHFGFITVEVFLQTFEHI